MLIYVLSHQVRIQFKEDGKKGFYYVKDFLQRVASKFGVITDEPEKADVVIVYRTHNSDFKNLLRRLIKTKVVIILEPRSSTDLETDLSQRLLTLSRRNMSHKDAVSIASNVGTGIIDSSHPDVRNAKTILGALFYAVEFLNRPGGVDLLDLRLPGSFESAQR